MKLDEIVLIGKKTASDLVNGFKINLGYSF